MKWDLAWPERDENAPSLRKGNNQFVEKWLQIFNLVYCHIPLVIPFRLSCKQPFYIFLFLYLRFFKIKLFSVSRKRPAHIMDYALYILLLWDIYKVVLECYCADLVFRKDGFSIMNVLFFTHISANIYLFKVNNGKTRKSCVIYSKLRIKTPKRN